MEENIEALNNSHCNFNRKKLEHNFWTHDVIIFLLNILSVHIYRVMTSLIEKWYLDHFTKLRKTWIL